MIEGLKSRYKVEECSFNTIFGKFEGHWIFASRKVAEKIEIQTSYAAELYNVDVRQDQRYMAEKDLLPCGDEDEARFSPDYQVPLSILGMDVVGDPNLPRDISCVQVLNEHRLGLSEFSSVLYLCEPELIRFLAYPKALKDNTNTEIMAPIGTTLG